MSIAMMIVLWISTFIGTTGIIFCLKRFHTSKSKEVEVLVNKEKIKLLLYLRHTICKYSDGGLCNASNFLCLSRVITFRELEILRELITEFKPAKTWDKNYYFRPGDYVSRVDWCNDVIRQLDTTELK